MAAPIIDWYLKEWLATLGENPTWLQEQTGWTHRINSQLVNRRLRWNRDHLALAARVLQIAPHELLLHPDEATHIRRLRAAETQLRAAEKTLGFMPFPVEPKKTG